MFVGRLVIGFSVGIASVVVPMYLGEIAPANFAGVVGTFHVVFLCFGIMYGQFISIPLSTHANQLWRLLFVISTPMTFLQIIFILCVPQSPKWLVTKNKIQEAEAELKKLRMSKDVSVEFNNLQAVVHASEPPKLKLLFQKSMIKPLFVGTGLMFFNQSVGINVVFSYS